MLWGEWQAPLVPVVCLPLVNYSKWLSELFSQVLLREVGPDGMLSAGEETKEKFLLYKS